MRRRIAAVPLIDESEIEALLTLSARIGRDPLLTQGTSGNTSLKLDGTLWVKASGKCMADAEHEQIFVPADLAACLESYQRGDPMPPLDGTASLAGLQPSIETFMHAVLPHRVIIHVHSVNAIAWAVRSDAALQLAVRLFGLNWCWIPYAESGFALAREIRLRARRDPRANIFVLANHGLVVGGDDCKSAESVLLEVERRLALAPRLVPQPNLSALEELRQFPGWHLPDEKTVHTLGTDGNSRRVVEAGVLYPCQAVFLGGMLPMLSRKSPYRLQKQVAGFARSSSFLILERSGVLINEEATPAELAAFHGYVEVVRRIESTAPLRCLTTQEVRSVLRSARDQGQIQAEPSMAAAR
jgi:rhamnose utilization protein RhaD (predicted bifunctional aldolase and dehydrogenase)